MQLSFVPQPELVVVPKPIPNSSTDGSGASLEEAGRSMQETLLRERLFSNSLAPATPSAGTAAVKAARRGWTDQAPDMDIVPPCGGASSIGCTFTGRFSTMDTKSMGSNRETDFKLNNGFSSAIPPSHTFLAVKHTTSPPTSTSRSPNSTSTSPTSSSPPPKSSTSPISCIGAISFELNADGIFPLNNFKNKTAFGLLERHKSDCVITKDKSRTVNKQHTMRPKAHQPSSLIMITCRDWMSMFTTYGLSPKLHKNGGYVCKDGNYAREFTVECTYTSLDPGYNTPNAWYQDYQCQVLPQVTSTPRGGSASLSSSSLQAAMQRDSPNRLVSISGTADTDVASSVRTQLRSLADSLETMNKDVQHKRAQIIQIAQQLLSTSNNLSPQQETKICEDAGDQLAALSEEITVRKDERYVAASRYRSVITYEPIFMAGFTRGDIGVWCPLRDTIICRLNNSSNKVSSKARVLDGGPVTAIACLKGSMQRAVERCTEAMVNDYSELYVGSGSGFTSKYTEFGDSSGGTPSSTGGAGSSTVHNASTASDGGIYAACYTSADILIFGLDSVSEGCVLRIVGGGIFGNRPLQSLSSCFFPWELNCALYPPITVWNEGDEEASGSCGGASSLQHALMSSLKKKKIVIGGGGTTPVAGFNADDCEEWPAISYLHRPPQVHNATSSAAVGTGHFVGLLWSQREVFTALVTSAQAVAHVFEDVPTSLIRGEEEAVEVDVGLTRGGGVASGRLGGGGDEFLDPSRWSPSQGGVSPRRPSVSRDDSADTFDTLSPPARSESPCVGSGITAALKRGKQTRAGGGESTSSSTFRNTLRSGGGGGNPTPHIHSSPSHQHSLAILAPTLSAHMFLLRSTFFNNVGFLTSANGSTYVLSLPTLKPIGTIDMRRFHLHGETLSVSGIANHCPGTAAYKRAKLAIAAHNVDSTSTAIDPILISNPAVNNNNNGDGGGGGGGGGGPPELSAPLQSILLSVSGERDTIDIIKVEIELPSASWLGLHNNGNNNNNTTTGGFPSSSHQSPNSASNKKYSASTGSIKPPKATSSSNNNKSSSVSNPMMSSLVASPLEASIYGTMASECIIPCSLSRNTSALCHGGCPSFGGLHGRSTSGGGGGSDVLAASSDLSHHDIKQLPLYVADTLRTESVNPLLAWIHSSKVGMANALTPSSQGDEYQPVRASLVKSLAGHSSWVLSTAAFPAPQIHSFPQASYIPLSDGPEVLAQHIADLQFASAPSPHNNQHQSRTSFAFKKTVTSGLFKVLHASNANRRQSNNSLQQTVNRSLSGLYAQPLPNITFGTAIAGLPRYAAVQKCLGETSPMTSIVMASVSMDQKVMLWVIEGHVSVSMRTPHNNAGGGALENRSMSGTPSPLSFTGIGGGGLNSNQVRMSHIDFHVQDESVLSKCTLLTDLTNDGSRTDHLAKVISSGIDGRSTFLLLAHRGKASLFDVEGYTMEEDTL